MERLEASPASEFLRSARRTLARALLARPGGLRLAGGGAALPFAVGQGDRGGLWHGLCDVTSVTSCAGGCRGLCGRGKGV
jgi:hypothetical protein